MPPVCSTHICITWHVLLASHSMIPQHAFAFARSEAHFGLRAQVCLGFGRRHRRMASEGTGSDGELDMPDELPLSDASEAASLPSEIPMESGSEGDGGTEKPTECIPELQKQIVYLGPRSDRAPSAASADADFALVRAPATKPKGRPKGRPRKAGPRLVSDALAETSEARSGTLSIFDDGPCLGQGPLRLSTTLSSWMSDQAPLQGAAELAKVELDGVPEGRGQVQGGFVSPPQLAVFVVGALARQLQGARALDPQVERVASFFLRSKSCVLTTTQALSLMLEVNRQHLLTLMHRCAAALCLLEQCRLNLLEARLAESLPRASLVHVVESAQYDETPLKVKVLGEGVLGNSVETGELGKTSQLPGPQSCSATEALYVGQSKVLQVMTTGAAQKIVQTRGSVGLVVKLGERLVTIIYHLHLPLAVVERTTGQVLKYLQLTTSRLSRAAIAFKGHTRAVTTDAFSGNKTAEASIMQDRAAATTGSSLHILCDVHATAGVYDKVFAPLDSFVTGVIRTALSLRSGAAMHRFRRCLRQEIEARLEVVEGVPPRSATDYKKKIIKVFVTHGGKAVTRRALLALCPNGEWRHPLVQFFTMGQSGWADKSLVLEHLTSGLVIALTSSQPALYNRSKWTGSDIAVDDLGVFESVHCLLSTTYARFCASFVSGSLAQQYLDLGASLRQYDRQVSAAGGFLADDQADDECSAGDAGGQQGRAGEAAPVEGPLQPPPGQTDQWAMQNAKDRRLAMQFLKDRPRAPLVLMRLLMEPLRQYMGKQFGRASDIAERLTFADIAAGASPTPEHFRRLPVVQVADGRDDTDFKTRVQLLAASKDLWSVLPPTSQTGRFRALAFACTSRMGCAFEKMLASRHKGFPWRTFLSFVDLGIAREVKEASECLLDPWTRFMRRLYPEFQGEELKQVLYTTATLLKVDTTNIESRHASVRRLLTVKSTQTHTMSFADLSAQWVFQQHRTRRPPASTAATMPVALLGGLTRRMQHRGVASAPGRPTATSPQKARGFAGPWRGWLHLYGHRFVVQGKVDMTVARNAYLLAKRTRAADYLRAAAVGKAAHKKRLALGRPGFGACASQRAKSLRSLQSWSLALRMRSWGSDSANRAFSMASTSLVEGVSVAGAVSAVRRSKRLEAQEEATAIAKKEEALQRFQATEGPALVDEVKRGLPPLASLPMQAEPSPCGVRVHVLGPTADELAEAVSWASAHSRHSGLATKLQKHWEALHCTLMQSDCPPMSDVKEEVSPCFRTGICLCSESGRRFSKLVNKFLRHMKQVCPQGSATKGALVTGKIVVRIIGRPLSFEDIIADEDSIVEIWYHVGLMYLSPYEPTFAVVRPVNFDEGMPASDERIYIEGTGECKRLHQGLLPFEHCETVSAMWYRLEESERFVGSFAPQPLPILKMASSRRSTQFWPRATMTRRSVVRRSGRSGDLAPDDDGKDDSSAADDAGGDPELDDGADDIEPTFADMLHPLLDAYQEDLNLADPEPETVAQTDGQADVRAAADVVEPETAPRPPPPPQPEVARGKRKRTKAGLQTSVTMANGTIVYFPSNGNFEARCAVHASERCTLTRKGCDEAGASSSSTVPAGQRPLGFLAAWLVVADSRADKKEHKDRTFLASLGGQEERRFRYECRTELGRQEGSDELLSHEAPTAAVALELEPERVR